MPRPQAPPLPRQRPWLPAGAGRAGCVCGRPGASHLSRRSQRAREMPRKSPIRGADSTTGANSHSRQVRRSSEAAAGGRGRGRQGAAGRVSIFSTGAGRWCTSVRGGGRSMHGAARLGELQACSHPLLHTAAAPAHARPAAAHRGGGSAAGLTYCLPPHAAPQTAAPRTAAAGGTRRGGRGEHRALPALPLAAAWCPGTGGVPPTSGAPFRLAQRAGVSAHRRQGQPASQLLTSATGVE